MLNLNIQEGKMQHVIASMPSESIDVIFADPPYNIANKIDKGMQYTRNEDLAKKNWKPHYAQYDTIDDYWSFARDWIKSIYRILKPKGSIFITGTHHNIHHIGIVLKELGFWCVTEIAWCKPNAMPSLSMYGPTQAVEWVLWYRKYEKIAHIYDKVAAKAYNKGINIKSFWIIPKPSDRLIKYPGRKPIPLVYRCIDIATDKQAPIHILDPFCGSGTTGDAARYLAQKYATDITCTLIDESPEALAVTRQRLALPMQPLDFYL